MMSKVVSGGEGCIGWMTNIVVTGGERYKSESTSGGVRVKMQWKLGYNMKANFVSVPVSLKLCVNRPLYVVNPWAIAAVNHSTETNPEIIFTLDTRVYILCPGFT